MLAPPTFEHSRFSAGKMDANIVIVEIVKFCKVVDVCSIPPHTFVGISLATS